MSNTSVTLDIDTCSLQPTGDPYFLLNNIPSLFDIRVRAVDRFVHACENKLEKATIAKASGLISISYSVRDFSTNSIQTMPYSMWTAAALF